MNISSSSAVSGMQASMLRQEVSAHDIAYINTEGFKQYIPHQASRAPSGTQISHISRETNTTGFSNTDLATEAVEQKTSVTGLKANSAVIKVQDRIMGALLDLFG